MSERSPARMILVWSLKKFICRREWIWFGIMIQKNNSNQFAHPPQPLSRSIHTMKYTRYSQQKFYQYCSLTSTLTPLANVYWSGDSGNIITQSKNNSQQLSYSFCRIMRALSYRVAPYFNRSNLGSNWFKSFLWRTGYDMGFRKKCQPKFVVLQVSINSPEKYHC